MIVSAHPTSNSADRVLTISQLRAVVTTDFMTAEPYPFEFDFLAKVSRAIVNQVHGVSLVVYNTTSKPPVSIHVYRYLHTLNPQGTIELQ